MDQVPEANSEPPAGAIGLGRLIQVVLALYLMPVLLIVLVVGGIGMVVLAAARVLHAVVRGRGHWPRAPIGPRAGPSADVGLDD
jgi:hypothetical protein